MTVAHYPPGTSKWNPNRAPTVQRDQQELGGTPPRQLRDHAPLSRHNHDQDWPSPFAPNSLTNSTRKMSRLPTAQMHNLLVSYHDTLPKWNYIPQPEGQTENRELFLRGP